jgi:hypothetical protein
MTIVSQLLFFDSKNATYLENPKQNTFGNNYEKEKLIINLFGNLKLYNSSRE